MPHHLLSINEWNERLPCADPLARCSSMLILASCSRCPEPLEAVPSTPSPTLTPACNNSFSGAVPAAHLPLSQPGQCQPILRSCCCQPLSPELAGVARKQMQTYTYNITSMLRLISDTHKHREVACCSPEASRKFEDGQCATPIPFSASCCISALSRKQQCANQTSLPSHSTSLCSSPRRISGSPQQQADIECSRFQRHMAARQHTCGAYLRTIDFDRRADVRV